MGWSFVTTGSPRRQFLGDVNDICTEFVMVDVTGTLSWDDTEQVFEGVAMLSDDGRSLSLEGPLELGSVGQTALGLPSDADLTLSWFENEAGGQATITHYTYSAELNEVTTVADATW